MELGKVINYKITIEPSQNKGFIVKIGCGRFVAENVDNLLKNLRDYLYHPEEWEKRYNEISPDQPQAILTSQVSDTEPERTDPA